MTTVASRAAPGDSTSSYAGDADWRAAMAHAVTDATELCRLLSLPSSVAQSPRAAGSFPLLVPRTFLGRIRPGDPVDPLLLQVLPRLSEDLSPPQFTADPVGDAEATCLPGLLGKYQGRLLMLTTGACGVHCRFCFRRHLLRGVVPLGVEQCEEAMVRIGGDPTVHEVILSGGDPLILGDSSLLEIVNRLARIPHVMRFRLHTGLPIMIPSRVTESLVAGLAGTRLRPLVVIHTNHPAEINGLVGRALNRFTAGGIMLLSQTVLLRDVNDRLETLTELFERLVQWRIIPYYLHQLDRVAEPPTSRCRRKPASALCKSCALGCPVTPFPVTFVRRLWGRAKR